MKAIKQQWLDYAKADLMNCEQIFDNAQRQNAYEVYREIGGCNPSVCPKCK